MLTISTLKRPLVLGVAFAALGLGSCANTLAPTVSTTANDELSPVSETEPALERPALISPQKEAASETGMQIFKGSGQVVNTRALSKPSSAKEGDDGVTLNFADASIPEVSQAVLGNILGLNYAIDPNVKGKITLQSSRPIPKAGVLAALENAFGMAGVTMVEGVNDTVNVVPLDAAKRGSASLQFRRKSKALAPGFSTLIVPLDFVAASEMEKVLRPLLPDGAVLTVDDQRNLIFLSGVAQELEAALEAVDLFDVNWLQGMSFALFTPIIADAETLTHELSLIFDNASNPMAGRIEMIPIPRLNGILVMTQEPEFLSEVRTWILRLDKGGQGPAPQIFVYDVQHGSAEEITSSLTAILGGGSGAVQSPAPINPETPANSRNGAVPLAEGLSAAVKIVANEKNNAIMVYGTVRDYDMVEHAILQLDVPVDQVLIEAAIAEVTLNDELKYGVQWKFLDGEMTHTQSDNGGGAVTSQFPGYAFTYFETDAQVALNALSSLTDVQVLSSPKIVVLNNQTATLQVGDQVPVATQSAVSITDTSAPIVNSVQFRDTGVILEVTPRINKNGIVRLEINQEVSDVIPTTTSGIDSPTIQQRKIKSTITVADGQTIALGGLIRDSQSTGKSGVPFLHKIPLFGQLFGSEDTSSRRTELLIFITPHVIHNMEEAESVTDYLRDQLTRTEFFNKAK